MLYLADWMDIVLIYYYQYDPILYLLSYLPSPCFSYQFTLSTSTQLFHFLCLFNNKSFVLTALFTKIILKISSYAKLNI